jgi:hypothetical protein
MLVGWVSAAALRPHAQRVKWENLGLSLTSEQLDIETAPFSPPHVATDPTEPLARNELPVGVKPVCAWNAPLIAKGQSDIRTIGTLASAIPLVPGATHDGLQEVILHHPDFATSANASFWIPERFVYRCEGSNSLIGFGSAQ